jgi:hypothetical protein
MDWHEAKRRQAEAKENLPEKQKEKRAYMRAYHQKNKTGKRKRTTSSN